MVLLLPCSSHSLKALPTASTVAVLSVSAPRKGPSPAPNFLDGCWLHPQGYLWPRQSGYSGPSSPGPERTEHRCHPSRGRVESGPSSIQQIFIRASAMCSHCSGLWRYSTEETTDPAPWSSHSSGSSGPYYPSSPGDGMNGPGWSSLPGQVQSSTA